MLTCMQEQKAPAAARAPASLMLDKSAGMQGSQRVSLEQYWLGRHAGSSGGQMHPGTGSAEEEGGMPAALHAEQSGAEAWGYATGLHGSHLEPAGGRGWKNDAGDARQSACLQKWKHVSAGQGPLCLMVSCTCSKLTRAHAGMLRCCLRKVSRDPMVGTTG